MAWVAIVHMPGPMAVKVPVLFPGIALISRAIGLGAFAPLMSTLRALWIVLRVTIDFTTDIKGPVEGWFWAFAISLTWPAYMICNYCRQAHASNSRENSSETAQGEDVWTEDEPATPSQRSYDTTRTASDSMHISESGRAVGTSRCQADGLLLSKRRNHPFAIGCVYGGERCPVPHCRLRWKGRKCWKDEQL